MSIVLENVDYIYQPGSPYETRALENISLEIKEGEFVGLIGPTGSGKSTLVQHFNGLLKATAGRVIIDNIEIKTKGIKIKDIRQKVGLVFQYPEHQLFEETVFLDIAFGPKNMGLDSALVEKRVKKAMGLVNLDYDRYSPLSPFVLSGGEKRRIALAGVLAMEPKYLILDEPTAGLDPKGRREILSHIAGLHKNEGLTIILVSHSMDDVARLANRLLVINRGKIVFDDETRKVFACCEVLQEMGLDVPTVIKLMARLREKGWEVRTDLLTVEEAKEEIKRAVRRELRDA